MRSLIHKSMNIFVNDHDELFNNELQWVGKDETNKKKSRKKRDSTKCPSINPPKNGQSSGQCVPGYPGKVCRFNCIPGYKKSGESSINCGLDGRWSQQPPTCLPMQ